MSITGQESHDVLLTCLTDERRFDNGRSVAAWIIYKTLLQWRSFELEKTHIFDRIVHKIRSSIEVTKLNTFEYKSSNILKPLKYKSWSRRAKMIQGN